MLSIILKLKAKIGFYIRKLTFSPIAYWEDRAQKYGERSVLNLTHSTEEMKLVKGAQIDSIFPHLKKELNGSEKTLLDFGCGPGRFSVDLANLTHCTVTGTDPIQHLLELAPKSDKVQYKLMQNGKITEANESFDVIWICLVLGGIVRRKELNKTIKELNRVSKKGGLLLLVENTSDKKNIISWKYRSVQKYIDLLKNFNLNHLEDYYDAGERISIFAGRKTKNVDPNNKR